MPVNFKGKKEVGWLGVESVRGLISKTAAGTSGPVL